MKKVYLKSYDYIDEDFYYKSLKTVPSSILTFNSKYYLVIKFGKLKGLRFKVLREKKVDLTNIPTDKPLVLLLNKRPYKILKYVNESEVIDVSKETEIFGRKIIIKNER